MQQSSPPWLDQMLTAICDRRFQTWRTDREHAQNIREGTPYYNNSDYVPDASRLGPHELLQCHRKLAYRQHNAPGEDQISHGYFWIGSQLEEEFVEEFLAQLNDVYVQNSLRVDYQLTHEDVDIQIAGWSDPVLCNADGKPLVLTEIKSRDGLPDRPLDRHRAQAHAYFYGLHEEYDTPIAEYLLIYICRETLRLQVFRESFDTEFWEQRVLPWAAAHVRFRRNGFLPPADPEQEYECTYCSYASRCGKVSSMPIGDRGYTGFLPLTHYPEETVQKHLEAYANEVALTPTLAHQHPHLVAIADVLPWQCRECDSEYDLEDITWDGETTTPPSCPQCIDRTLRGPLPSTHQP